MSYASLSTSASVGVGVVSGRLIVFSGSLPKKSVLNELVKNKKPPNISNPMGTTTRMIRKTFFQLIPPDGSVSLISSASWTFSSGVSSAEGWPSVTTSSGVSSFSSTSIFTEAFGISVTFLTDFDFFALAILIASNIVNGNGNKSQIYLYARKMMIAADT